MVASGLLDANKYGEAMVKIGEEARRLKREGEEGRQANTLLGVMLKAKIKDEMGAVLVEYGGKLKQGAVDKAVTAYEKVTKSFSRDEMNDIRLQIAEMRGATRAGGSGDGSTAMIKNAEFMVQRGIAKNYQEAYQMLNTAKDNPEALVKTLVSEGIKNNAMLPQDEQKTPKQIAQEARSVVQELYGNQTTPPQPGDQQQGVTKFDEALLLNPAPTGGPQRGMTPQAPKPRSSRGAAGLNSFYR